MKFPSTLLPETNDPVEIKKAILDLLDKINQISVGSAAIPTGAIQMYGGATAPEGFLLCDGATYRCVEYPELFAKIGGIFGAPDSATFKVPDFRGVSPAGTGAQAINGRTKTGPVLGEVREDQFQGHYHNPLPPSTSIFGLRPGGLSNDGATAATFHAATTGSPVTDGVNGAPRTWPYTHGPEVGVNFIIKV